MAFALSYLCNKMTNGKYDTHGLTESREEEARELYNTININKIVSSSGIEKPK